MDKVPTREEIPKVTKNKQRKTAQQGKQQRHLKTRAFRVATRVVYWQLTIHHLQ